MSSITDGQILLPNEIIIVEDGPLNTDLYRTLDKYSAKYPAIVKRIKLSQNLGMGKAMNAGLMEASYEFIARMDSDDVSMPDRFQKQICFLIENPEIDVIGSLIREFLVKPGDINKKRPLPEQHDDIVKYLKYRNPINHMTVIYRRKLAIAAGGYWDNRVYEDYNLWYEMAKHGAKFYNLQESLVDARIGNNMVGRRRGADYLKNEIVFFKKLSTDKFISKPALYYNIALRVVLRLIPKGLLEWVYFNLLRSTHN